MRFLAFNHPKYKSFKGYVVSSNGKVFHKTTGVELNYHIDERKIGNTRFVRLSATNKALSITIARLMLLTFEPKGYKENGEELLAIHKDGNSENDKLSNLIWGDRSCKSLISMKNPKYRKRIISIGFKARFKTKSKHHE